MSDENLIDDFETASDWLDMIADAERYMDGWNTRADAIDRLYADLERLSGVARDRQFALFWSNIQVMLPAIYARTPQPVVVPKFNARTKLMNTASEFLERNIATNFERSNINSTMLALRDDVAIVGRGVAWITYKDDGTKECAEAEWVYRRDFMHEPARRWCDVGWVARRTWPTRREVRKRFGAEVANQLNYHSKPSNNDDQLSGAMDYRERAPIWEIWHKHENCVVWVSEGYDGILEKSKPHLRLEGFFPCPEPVYATVQRNTLIPVPDIVYYKDQLEEINDLTARIHALGRALVLKGFYTASGETGDALETALNNNSDGKMLIPVSASAMLSMGQNGDPIMWMPLEQVANAIVAAVELRKQLMTDVYELIGLSDIMRGQTQADETLGAQQLKQQNGSYRVRDKQSGLVRIARDIACITGEIMSEEFSAKTLEDGAQMELPTDADVKRVVKEIENEAKAAITQMGEQFAQMAQQQEQQDPNAAQQAEQAMQQAIGEWGQKLKDASEQVTIDQVMQLLRDDKLRPYMLDIETDSTIYPDEQAAKQSAIELLEAFSGTMSQVSQWAQLGPQGLALAGGFLKKTMSVFRMGRELDGLVEDFVDSAPQIAERMAASQDEGKGDDMAALAEAEMEKAKAQMAKVQADAALKQADLQQRMTQMQIETQEKQAKLQLENGKLQLQASKQEQEFAAKMADMDARQNLMQAQTAEILTRIGLDARKQDLEEYKAANDAQMKQAQLVMGAEQQAVENERAEVQQATDVAFRAKGEQRADRQQEFTERQPPKAKL